MVLLKCCIWCISKLKKKNSPVATGLEKVSVHFNWKEGQCERVFKLLWTCTRFCKIIFKILQVMLQQYMNWKLPDVQAGFRKGRGTKGQIANICWITEKVRVPEKHLFLLYWLCQSLWPCGSQQTVENSSRDRNTRPVDVPPEKSVCRSRSNS